MILVSYMHIKMNSKLLFVWVYSNDFHAIKYVMLQNICNANTSKTIFRAHTYEQVAFPNKAIFKSNIKELQLVILHRCIFH